MKGKILKTSLILITAILVTILIATQLPVLTSFGVEDTQVVIEAELEKYINYSLSSEDEGTLVQYGVNTKMELGEGKEYSPIKTSETTVQLSKIDGVYPTRVKVIPKSTQVTNGKTSNIKDNYTYSANTGKVVIKASNQDEEGKEIYAKQPSENARDSYSIICYYDTYKTDNPERELSIKVATKNILFADDMPVNGEKTLEIKQAEDIGKLTSVSYETSDIYNGYIKSNIINGTNYNTPYQENESIMVSKKEAQETIDLKEQNSEHVIYKSTKISKEDITKLLGEEGSIEIVDELGENIATINKDTKFDEDGTTTINYEKEIGTIGIKTSEIKDEGILTLENSKEIKNTMQTVETQITTKNEIAENTVEIKDAKTDISMEINSTKWTNKQQNEIEFNVYMKANNMQKNMLKDPTVRIELPSQVEKVILGGSSVVYGHGLTLEDPYIEQAENGNIVIVANLKGAQKEYNDNDDLDLITDLKIAATVILKKDIENENTNIQLTYTNQFTTDGALEVGEIKTAIEVESYREEEKQQIEGIAPIKYEEVQEIAPNAKDLKVEVAPVRGGKTLTDGETLYEGEFVKYNIKITNTSSEPMDNVRIVGSIPEGMTYGELQSDFYTVTADYKYNFDNNLRNKEINIGTIKPGQEIETYYEVQVNDIEEAEKQITTNIKAYIGNGEAANFVLDNTIKPAEVKLFLGSGLYMVGGNTWVYTLDVTTEKPEVTVQIAFPKYFGLTSVVQQQHQIPEDTMQISDDNILTVNLDTTKGNLIIGGAIDYTQLAKDAEDSKNELIAIATVTDKNVTYTSNENRMVIENEDISVTLKSSNEGEEVKYGDEINYQISIRKTGRKNSEDMPIQVKLQDFLPNEVVPVSVKYENWERVEETGQYEKNEKSEDISTEKTSEDGVKMPNVDLLLNIPYGETVNVEIKAKAGLVYQNTKIENNVTATFGERVLQINKEGDGTATISEPKVVLRTSNTVAHIILPYDYKEVVPDDEETPPTDEEEGPGEETTPPVDEEEPGEEETPPTDEEEEPGEEETPPVDEEKEPGEEEEKPSTKPEENPGEETTKPAVKNKFNISGIVWNDENEDGQRQLDEKRMSNINVMLINAENSNIVKDNVKTDANGNYSFSDIEEGKYIVIFQYDTDTYKMSEYQKSGVSESLNCDTITKKITVNNNQLLVGATDIIELNEIKSNIDAGLIKNKICDMKLDKYVSKIIVTTNNGTKQYAFSNEKLAKAEIRSKEIEGATVVIEYKIVITNNGEIPSIVNKVIDEIPDGLTFSSELNTNWAMQTNGKLINTSTSNQKIQVGESKVLTLTLTKKMTANNTGTFTNNAEITEISNSLNAEDSDKTNNTSKADTIISIGTGLAMYISVGVIILALAVVGVVLLKVKKIKINKLGMFIITFMVMMSIGITDVRATTVIPWTVKFLYDENCTTGSQNAFGPDYFFGSDSQVGDGRCDCPGEQANSYWTTYTLGTNHPQWRGWMETSWVDYDSQSDVEGNLELYKIGSDEDIQIQTVNRYYVIGPFSMAGSEQSGYNYEIYDKQGSKIDKSVYSICDRDGYGKKLEVSGGMATFYIRIPISSCVNGISRVRVQIQRDKHITTTVKTYGRVRYMSPGVQDVLTNNTLLVDVSTTTDTVHEQQEVEWAIKRSAKLVIVKEDKDNNNNKLDNVTFVIKNLDDTASYIRVNNADEITGSVNANTRQKVYSIQQATKFKTDRNGMIQITNLEVGTYAIREITNSHYGYTKLISEQPTKLSAVESLNMTIENEKQTGNLDIVKVDKDTNKPLEGVEFKIQKQSNGKYLKVKNAVGNKASNTISGDKTIVAATGEQIEFVDTIEEATTFVTDKNGRICISNVLIGYYNLTEISVGDHFGYDAGAQVTTRKVERQLSYNTEGITQLTNYYTTLKIDNEKKTGNLNIVKVDKNTGKTLEGVEFKIQKDDDKTYLKVKNAVGNKASNKIVGNKTEVAATGEDIEYVQKIEDATTFVTDKNGRISISDLFIGDYNIVEVSVGENYGYVVNPEISTLTVKRQASNNTDGLTEVTRYYSTIKIDNERKTGNLEIEKVDKEDHNRKLKGVEFKIYAEDDVGNKGYLVVVDKDGKAIEKVSNSKQGNKTEVAATGEQLKYTNNINQATTFVTDEDGKVNISDVYIGKYTIDEISIGDNLGYKVEEDAHIFNQTVTRQDSTYTMGVTEVTDHYTKIVIENDKKTGDLKIIKIDKDTRKPMDDIGFVIKSIENDGYLKLQDDNGNYLDEITGKFTIKTLEYNYVSRDQATKFITDENGEIYITNILKGKYLIEEVSLGKHEKYYEITNENQDLTDVQKPHEPTILTMENERKYIDLSGYVWENLPGRDKKTTETNKDTNALFKGNATDQNDTLFNGITVRLKDKRTGEVVKGLIDTEQDGKIVDGEQQTKTRKRYVDERNTGDGEYFFEKVKIDELPYYYIEFEYDGLTYTNVPVVLDAENGSKAKETKNVREQFNEGFSYVEGTSRDTGITKDANQNKKYDLKYDTSTPYKATIIHDNQFTMQSDTRETYTNTIVGTDKSTPKEIRETGLEEIRNINLGLYKREQPDLALVKDLQEIKMSINGNEHVYEYNQRFLHEKEYDSDGGMFNVGVKFGEKYPRSYTRAIYEEDYKFTTEDKSRELKVYVTYKIAISNNSNVPVRVNNIVDYYDSRYNIVDGGIGTKINETTRQIEGAVDYSLQEYNKDGYRKLQINNNVIIDAHTTNYDLYVQFELNKDAVMAILNGGETLDNVAEINSYSPLQKDENGNYVAYAGIDIDSNPGNGVPTDVNTFEDDIEASPALKLEVADARELSGKVFLDEADQEKLKANIRQGSGAYEDGEKGIAGVEVTLKETSGSGKVYTTTTNNEGDFLFKSFIPGDYVLTYTWGDETYTVQNYKGTIYDKSRYERNMNNKKWYKDESSTPRLTDAIDNIETRKAIDAELHEINYATKPTITKMDSNTPAMNFGVEYETTYTASTGDKYVYKIINIDFGIVERPRQDMELSKRVASMKVTLANGQLLTDIQIDENGNIVGEATNITYMKPSDKSYPKNGYLRLELDNELIQGATVEVGYIITAKNNSEIDYISDDYEYYKYGIETGEIVTITPKTIVDYLDEDWAFDENKNPGWKVTSKDELRALVDSSVFGEDSGIDKKTILITDKFSNVKLEPGQSESININVSKMMTTTTDVNLDNETEIIELTKTGGPKPTSTPGNYVPGKEPTTTPDDNTTLEHDNDMAETIIVTPNTGANRNFIIPVLTGITLIAIIGAGIVVIKKKVIKS